MVHYEIFFYDATKRLLLHYIIFIAFWPRIVLRLSAYSCLHFKIRDRIQINKVAEWWVTILDIRNFPEDVSMDAKADLGCPEDVVSGVGITYIYTGGNQNTGNTLGL